MRAQRGGAPPLFLQVGTGGLQLNAKPVALGELASAVAAAGAGTGRQAVLVAPARDLTAQGLVDVLVVLAQVPALDVAVLE